MGADVTTLGIAVDSSGVRRASDDMGKLVPAGRAAAASANELENAMLRANIAGTAIGNGIGVLFDGAMRLVGGFINLGLSVGRYQDLAEKTGSDDPVGLASLRTAADVAGTSVESVAQAINRMAVQLGKGDEDSSVGRALKAINIDIDEFKKLSGVEQYRELAKALDGFGDTQKKVQVIQAVTGRGGAEQLVMLKELATGYDNYNLLTKEQIQLADKLEDNTARSRSQLRQMAEVLSVQALPAIDAVTASLKGVISEMLGVGEGSDGLKGKAKSGVAEFAEGAVTFLGFVVDAGDGVIRTFQGVGMAIGAMTAQQAAFRSWDFSGAKKVSELFLEDMDALLNKPLFSDRLAASMAKAKAEATSLAAAAKAAGGSDGKPEIDFDPKKDRTERIRAERDEYKALIDTLSKKQAAEQLEFDTGRKLDDAERQRIDIYAQINRFKKLLTDTQMDAVDAHLLETDALVKANKAREDEVKLQKEALSMIERAGQAQVSRAERAEQEAKNAETLLSEYGKTADMLDRMHIIALRKEASDKRAEQLALDGLLRSSERGEALGREAAALDRAATAQEKFNAKKSFDRTDPTKGAERAVAGYLEHVKNAGEATEQAISQGMTRLEDQLVSFATTGKGDINGLIDYTIAEFTRLAAIRPLLNSLLSSFSGGSSGGGVDLSGIFGSILGMFTGGGSAPPKAFGGDVDAFSRMEVAERGPELATLGGKTYLMTGSKSGTVTSNDRIGGGGGIMLTSAPNIRIDSRADQAQVAAIVSESIAISNRELIAQLKAAGKL